MRKSRNENEANAKEHEGAKATFETVSNLAHDRISPYNHGFRLQSSQLIEEKCEVWSFSSLKQAWIMIVMKLSDKPADLLTHD